MKIDIASLKKILGDCNDIVVYGLHDCGYATFYRHLKDRVTYRCFKSEKEDSNYNIYNYSNIPFNHVNHNAPYSQGVLNVIAENCLRFEEGKPLVKLLFFIGLDANTRNKKIDLNLVVNGKGFDCITNRELRVLYKVYSDYGPEVAGIVNKTVVFVRLHEINDKECEYTLDVLPKIWEDPSWDDLWKNRLRNHHGDCTATRTWAAFFMPYLNRANLTFAESPARKSRLF